MVSSAANTVAEYLSQLDEPRKSEIESLLELIRKNIPAGYDECMRWGMISFEVPMEVSGPTYNKQPLNYVALASQKNYISIYLLSIYSSVAHAAEFESRWAKSGKKLNMGKACVRLKNLEQADLETIAWAVGLASPTEYVAAVQAARQR
jgi:hypothetical protein